MTAFATNVEEDKMKSNPLKSKVSIAVGKKG